MRNGSRDAVEAILFKPAAGGGFVYQAPKPWLFGKARNYLANEAQKAEIVAVMAPDVPVRRRVVIIGALILSPLLWAGAVATLMWAISGHDEPTFGDIVAMLILIVVPMLLALFLALAWSAQAQLAKLAPLIARLQPTEQQITRGDQRRGLARSMSFRALLLIIGLFTVSALISAFTLGMRLALHTLFTGSSVLFVVNLVIPLVAAGAYLALALLKAEQGRTRAPY